MSDVSHAMQPPARLPAPSAVLELFKPVTWFPPMWAFSCGVVSSGQPIVGERAWQLALGIGLTGPLVCATSQAVNDWFDRHVDAVNEPKRPIPSGRIPGRWGLYLAILWTAVSLAVASLLGPVGLGATAIALLLAWMYSAPPFRLKANGWWGNAAVGFTYEGLAWVTGAAVALGGAMPGTPILLLALLYSLGAHGIMTLNDFKAIEGDLQFGVRSLPVRLGVQRAAWAACVAMLVPQTVVVSLLATWGKPLHAAAVVGLMLVQLGLMARFLKAPREQAIYLSAFGVPFFVSGMMVSAFAVRTVLG
jgi:chlorophyll/bacteriochlorophyll a synthase